MLSYGMILDKIKNYKWQKSFIRYFTFIFMLMITVFLAIGSFAYHGYEVNRKKEIQENARDTLFTVHKEFGSLFTSVDNYINDAIVNDNVNLFMLSADIQNHINIMAIHEIINNMVMYEKGQTYINSIYLYSPASGYIISSSTFTNNFYRYFADKQWMDQYEKYHDEIVVRNFNYNIKDYKYVSIIKAIPNKNGRAGYVVFNIDAASLMGIDASDELYIVDSQGDIVLSNKEDTIQRNISYDEQLYQEFSNILQEGYKTSLYDNGTVISSVNINHTQYSLLIKENLSKYGRSSMIGGISLLLILLAIVSISLGIAFFMVMQFYKAVIGLVTVLEEPNNKNLTRLLKNNEVGFIQQRMLLLLRKNSEIEIELGKRVAMLNKANILTLQSQMNPHFIINVLNLISSLSIAENGYDTDMVKCISKLSEMLRIAMDSSKQLISLDEEIYYLELYLYITNMRFRDRFTVDWHIDDTTRRLKVVKMTLQPIVENAFNHGAFREGNIGIITITSEQRDNMLIVQICDNGDGISPEELSALQRKMNEEKLEKEHSMGLYNVNQRIKLLFGEEYGCSIASDQNGTVVTIRYPFMGE